MDELDGYLWGKVPRQFYRQFEDRPFDACDFCRKFLLADGVGYSVHKYYAAGELKQEFAVCDECSDGLRRSYSKESLQTLDDTFGMARTLSEQRARILLLKQPDKVERLTRHCLLCGAAKDQVPGYIEDAYCDGEEIVYWTFPLMICEPCAIKVHESLSLETKEVRRRFFTRHFGYPPEPHLLKEPAALAVPWMR